MGELGSGRVVAGVIFVGAVLATIGNALHPFLEPDPTARVFLETVHGHGAWSLLHFTIMVAVVLLAAGIVVVCRSLAETAGGPFAGLASVFAVVGVTIFAIQIGGIDGVVAPRLAEMLVLAEDPDAVLVTAEAMLALDVALLGMVVAIYFGALFLAFGLALVRAGAFARWLRWVAVVSGAAGLVIGPMMVLGVANEVTFYAFRAVALAATVVAFGVAVQLYGGTSAIPARTAPSITTAA